MFTLWFFGCLGLAGMSFCLVDWLVDLFWSVLRFLSKTDSSHSGFS